MRDYYTIKEAAYLLRVSPSTIRNWIKMGKLKAFTLQSETRKEWDFNDRVDQSNMDVPIAWYIKPEALDELIFDMPVGSMRRFECSCKKRDLIDCMDMLDRKEQELYDQLETIDKIKSYIRKEIEPYN